MYALTILFSLIVIISSLFITDITTKYVWISHYCIVSSIILASLKFLFEWAKTIFNVDTMKQLIPLFLPSDILWRILNYLYSYPDMYTTMKGSLAILQLSYDIDLQSFLNDIRYICIDKTVVDNYYSNQHIAFYSKAFKDEANDKRIIYLSYTILADSIIHAFNSSPISEIDSEYIGYLQEAWQKTHSSYSIFDILDFDNNGYIDTDKLFLSFTKNY